MTEPVLTPPAAGAHAHDRPVNAPGLDGPATIEPLTGLRGVAALWVVVLHFNAVLLTLLPGLAVLRPVIEHGWLGVEIFFVLSGFVIAHNYADRLAVPTRAEVRRFWWARVARVYPVHLVTLLAVLAMVVAASIRGIALTTDANYNPTNIVGNALLLQAVPGFLAINWPAWSVSCEAVAYLAFPLLAVGLARLTPRQALVSAIVVVLACVGGMQLLGLVAPPWEQLGYASMWLRIAAEFTAGALSWVWWRSRDRRGRVADAVALTSLGAGAAGLYLFGQDSPGVYVLLPLIVLFVVAVASSTGPVATVLSSRAAQWLGRISYSLYMVHFFVFLLAKKLFGWDQYADASLGVRAAVLLGLGALVIATAAATYRLVEEPGRRLTRRLSRSGSSIRRRFARSAS